MSKNQPGWRVRFALGVAVAAAAAVGVASFQPASASPDPAGAAGSYLQAHAAQLGLRPNLADLVAHPAQATLGGSTVTYDQVAGQYPVHDAQVKVTLDKSGNVLLVVSSYKQVQGVPVAPNAVGAKQAADAAQAHLASSGAQAHATGMRQEVLAEAGLSARQVWRVVSEGAGGNGSRETVDDSASGRVLSSRSLMQYDTGTGRVFNPNPVVTSLDPSLRDNGDQDSPQLTAQLQQVTLLGLDSKGYLDGQFE